MRMRGDFGFAYLFLRSAPADLRTNEKAASGAAFR
jgi:hypothetical protein